MFIRLSILLLLSRHIEITNKVNCDLELCINVSQLLLIIVLLV